MKNNNECPLRIDADEATMKKLLDHVGCEDDSTTSDYYELILQTWNHTDEQTKTDNNYSLRQFVESGDFASCAIDDWLRNFNEGLYLSDLRNEADYLESAIRAFSQMFSDWQYDVPWGIPKNV